jgi:GxxExxY protein
MNNQLETLINISNDIYNSIGPGYNEVIYHRAFEVALRLNNVPYESEVITPVFYKGHNIGHGRVDIKLNNFIIELKALSNFNNNDNVVQIKNYMKHYNIQEGLVINFGQPSKNCLGKVDFKYIFGEKIYTFLNGTFVETVLNLV